jgi:hypothetical protein
VLLVLVFKVSVGDAGHISVLILLHEKIDRMDTYPPLLVWMGTIGYFLLFLNYLSLS